MAFDLSRLEFDSDGYASTQVEVDGQEVRVGVTFQESVRRELLERLAPVAADIRRLDLDARQSLRENLARGQEDDAMPMYRSHHIAELEPSLARRFFDVDRSDPAVDEVFLGSMRLVRVGIYPESEQIVCDYTISADVTDYVVAVTFGSNGKVQGVSLES
jgi:hypothetical protein